MSNGQDGTKNLWIAFGFLVLAFVLAMIFVQFQIWVLNKYDAEFAEWVIDTYDGEPDPPGNPEVPNYPL